MEWGTQCDDDEVSQAKLALHRPDRAPSFRALELTKIVDWYDSSP